MVVKVVDAYAAAEAQLRLIRELKGHMVYGISPDSAAQLAIENDLTAEAGRDQWYMVRVGVAALEGGAPFYWHAHVTAAVHEAAKSYPTSTIMALPLLYCDTGWFWFDQPLLVDPATSKYPPRAVVGLGWVVGTTTPAHGKPTAIHVIAFVQDIPVGTPECIPGLSMELRLGESVEAACIETLDRCKNDYADDVMSPQAAAEDLPRQLVTWFFAAQSWLQQRILVPATRPFHRHLRKRSQREAPGVPPIIRIVHLRTREGAPRHDTESPEAFDYSCRWVVRGHWRNQYYPTSDIHAPKWINPYVKGPDDKPLRTVTTVFNVAR